MSSLSLVSACAHTPWLAMLALALPEHRLHTLPARAAPAGWRLDQRDLPSNVTPWPGGDYWERVCDGGGDAVPLPDLVLVHGLDDLARALGERMFTRRETPLLCVQHNHAAFMEPGLIHVLNAKDIPVVSISPMKAQSLREAGYAGRLHVIPPYVRREWFLPRTMGDTAAGGALTVCNGIRRPLFDLEWWLDHAAAYAETYGQTRLLGSGNTKVPWSVGAASSWDGLREAYAGADIYLNPTCAPYEDAYGLAALEAHAAGVPVVSCQAEAWDTLVTYQHPFDMFDRERFRRQWLVALAESTDG